MRAAGDAVTVCARAARGAARSSAPTARRSRGRSRLGHPAGARALWQKPFLPKPQAGDQLLLIGSPYGLEGTVTTGVVSRVTSKAIQTDAAANPGNSGGPAVDKQGRVVGILVSGGGENLNFAVPIERSAARCAAVSRLALDR